MVGLAVLNDETWRASDVELERGGPSYTIDTLSVLHRTGLDPSQIFFIIGADAFAEIATWSRYPRVLDAAHFAVVARPGTSAEALRARLPDLRARMVAPEEIEAGLDPRILLVEAETPDVSSTDIRRRAQAGAPLAGLVPEPVAVYITRHNLYVGPTCGRQ
jgi:nicotinate-nucleotide adenylyltransferase